MTIPLTERERQILYADVPAMKTAPPATLTDEHLALDFEVKVFSAERREIEGLASTPHLDLVGDVVQIPGAFTRTIAAGTKPELRVNHDQNALPIGAVTELEERPDGLRMKARVFATSAGDDLLTTVRELMAIGKTPGLSIGYRVRPGGAVHERVNGKLVRKLVDLDLSEVSVCTQPANERALVIGVKAQQDADHAALMASLDAKVEQEDRDLIEFFEEASRQAERDIREYFDPGITIREGVAAIDAKLADQHRRDDLAVDVTLVRIEEALRR